MAKDLAIVLSNGSINSAVATALAAQKYRPVMVHVGSNKPDLPSRRKAAYDAQVGHFKPFREHTFSMHFLDVAPEKGLAVPAAADPRVGAPILPTLRDLTPLLGVAVNFAISYDAAAIYTGLRVGPSTDELAQATEFLQIWNEMAQISLGRPELEVMAPLLELEMWQVVDLGFQVNAPLDRTWSCIEDHADACRACRSCRAREAAFMQAAKPDPVPAGRR